MSKNVQNQSVLEEIDIMPATCRKPTISNRRLQPKNLTDPKQLRPSQTQSGSPQKIAVQLKVRENSSVNNLQKLNMTTDCLKVSNTLKVLKTAYNTYSKQERFSDNKTSTEFVKTKNVRIKAKKNVMEAKLEAENLTMRSFGLSSCITDPQYILNSLRKQIEKANQFGRNLVKTCEERLLSEP